MKKQYIAPFQQTPQWDLVPKVTLTHTSWLTPSEVAAWAQVCHNDRSLLIRLTARESPIRATLTGPLDSVCTDSCLEFFFAPDAEDPRYFNFEFNPLGTLFLGFGTGREDRVRLIVPDSSIFHFRTAETNDGWEISYEIPVSFVQLFMPGFSFQGTAACNFYKCGDLTPEPHYLSWAPIHCSNPDYHRREDFGILRFESCQD